MKETRAHAAVGERIAWHRKCRLGMSQEEYAASIGASRSQVANWEKGINRPAVEYALRLDDRYGLDLNFIYKGDDARLPQALLDAWREYRAKVAAG